MSYEGSNSVILRVQMRIGLWPVDIVHRTRDFNVDSDYMSKLANNTRFDPLLAKYLTHAAELRSKYPPPGGEMLPEHMPGYRAKKRCPSSGREFDIQPGVRIDGEPVTAEADHVSSLMASVAQNQSRFADIFSIYPVRFIAPTDAAVPIYMTTLAQSGRAAIPPASPPPP